HRLVRGRRRSAHPIEPRPPLASLRAQAGNADDVLVAALHGRDWRARAGAPRGRLRRHAIVTAAAALALAAALGGRRRAARAAGLAWLAGSAELAVARLAPGPREAAEWARMLATSLLIPPAAVWHHLRGRARVARLRRAGRLAWRPAAPQLRLVLLDRDGTLIEDDSAGRAVRPMPTARR